MMLTAPVFAQSNRCKSFLSYVVLQTLSGNAGQLKERTIGISVFDRATDYPTGEDSIVRVTANEVRKRIGQFYRESPVAHPIQIELPRGAYVPEFRIRPAISADWVPQTGSSDSLSTEASPELTSVSPENPSVVSPVQSDVSPVGHPQLTPTRAGGKSARKLLLSVRLPVLLLAIVAAALGIWKSRTHNKFPEMWDGFLHAKVPVLICLGAHNIPVSNVVSPSDTEKFSDLVLHKQIIPIDDATVITSLAGVLGKKGIPFRIAGAGETSLTDLRMQPVILIGAVDNKWTLRLTQSLRYRLEVNHPSGRIEPVASIVDAKQPASGEWKIDFSIPMSQWKNDYAIVARLDDATTGVPVLIEAGLGNDGSLAASELVTSGTLMPQVANEPGCVGKSNFEAVVGTEIIDAKSGPPHVLRLTCW